MKQTRPSRPHFRLGILGSIWGVKEPASQTAISNSQLCERWSLFNPPANEIPTARSPPTWPIFHFNRRTSADADDTGRDREKEGQAFVSVLANITSKFQEQAEKNVMELTSPRYVHYMYKKERWKLKRKESSLRYWLEKSNEWKKLWWILVFTVSNFI